MSLTRPQKELSLARARCRGLLYVTIFFSIFTNLLMLTGPLFMLQVYDRVLGSRAEETLVALFALVAALFLCYGLLEFARGRVMARVGARFQSVMNARVFSAVLERAALRRGAKGAGALQDLEAIRTFYTSPVLLALLDMPWTPVFLAAIFIFHPMLGWLALAGGSLLILVTLANQLLTRAKVADAHRYNAAAAAHARQTEDGADLVWAQGMGPAMSDRWITLQDESLSRSIRANDWTGSFTAFGKAFRLFLQSAILALGAYLVLQNEMTAGAMIAASILMGRALAPVEQGLAQWSVVQRARGGWQALAEFLDGLPARTAPTELPAPEAHLSVDNVTVLPGPGEKPVLHGVGLSVAPGEALGVLGKSGSGKTTLARVIVGLVSPATGEVRLGGATLDQYGPARLGEIIGYLPQDVRLFDGTIAENIAQMDLEPDSQRVVAAAQKAKVHDVVLKLPQGYDTRIGRDDAQLSGGQKQRLALARALYRDPVLLVLDEPNSALDAEGSAALNAAITEMKAAGRAVLIMTHRPNAISTCDRLLVLDGGKAAASGPRDEIIRAMMKNAGDVTRVVAAGASA